MMKVLVTGAAGFIGFHVSQALLTRGDTVIGIDNLNPYYDPNLKQSRLKILNESEEFTFHKTDLSDYNDLIPIFQDNKFDKICHLAAQAGVRYSLTNPFEYEKSNNLATLNLLELARKFKITDFVFASSSSVYGANKKVPFSTEDKVDTPISLYAATKKYTELIAYTYSHLYTLNCTGLRFFTVYGPFGRPDMALYIFTKKIIEGNPIEVYNNGNMKRDFTYITDIVAGVLASLDKPFRFKIFNLGNSQTVELNYFISCIEKELEMKAKKIHLPLQPGDVPITFADIKDSTKLLGFKPETRIEDGINKFIKWYKQYHKI